MELAKEHDCGPFQIASNKVLDQLANIRPDRLIPLPLQQTMVRLAPSIQHTYRVHLETAASVIDLSRIRCVSESTMWGYLCSAVELGLPVHLDKLDVDRNLINTVLDTAREKLDGDVFRLKPLMEALPPDFIDYNRLKIIRAILLWEYESDSTESSTP
ncbi:hypothetical protein GCK32_014119, partial [Trichostrongylus colubriformis]